MGYAYLIAGMVFLCNPLVNIVDVLPDCIGYFLILLGIEKMTYADVKMAAFRQKIRFLMFLTLPKIVLGIFAIGGSTKFQFLGDSTMVLVYAFCYAVAEPILMWRAFDLFFDGLYRLGITDGSSSEAVLYREKHGKKIRAGARIQTLTHWFIVLRAVLSVLPQFIFTADLTYLEYDIYGVYMDVRDALPVLFTVCVLLMLPLSIIWCVSMCRYFGRIQREAILNKNTDGAIALLGENYTLMRQRNTFHDGFWLLFLGTVCFFHLTLDGISLLPSFAGVLIVGLALFIIRRDMPATRKTLITGALCVPVGVAAYIVSVKSAATYFSAVWATSFAGWGADAARMFGDSPSRFFLYLGFYLDAEDTAAWNLQLLSFVLTLAESVLLCFFMHALLDVMKRFVTRGGEALMQRYCLETGIDENRAKRLFERQPKRIFAVFVIFMIFTALGEHPLFVYYLTPIPEIRVISGLIFLLLQARYMRNIYRGSED